MEKATILNEIQALKTFDLADLHYYLWEATKADDIRYFLFIGIFIATLIFIFLLNIDRKEDDFNHKHYAVKEEGSKVKDGFVFWLFLFNVFLMIMLLIYPFPFKNEKLMKNQEVQEILQLPLTEEETNKVESYKAKNKISRIMKIREIQHNIATVKDDNKLEVELTQKLLTSNLPKEEAEKVINCFKNKRFLEIKSLSACMEK